MFILLIEIFIMSKPSDIKKSKEYSTFWNHKHSFQKALNELSKNRSTPFMILIFIKTFAAKENSWMIPEDRNIFKVY